ncbi:type VII secretion protein EssB/YukC [Bacillus sp. SL00103]
MSFLVHYWTRHVKTALDIARVLGDDRYIFTALVAHRNDIQNDDSLSAEENKNS